MSLPRQGGHYRHAVRKGNLVWVSGEVAWDAEQHLVGADIETQTRQTLTNVRLALETVGASLADLVMVNGYLADVGRDFAGYDRVYREFFPDAPPARASVGVGLAPDVLVEISGTAVVD